MVAASVAMLVFVVMMWGTWRGERRRRRARLSPGWRPGQDHTRIIHMQELGRRGRWD